MTPPPEQPEHVDEDGGPACRPPAGCRPPRGGADTGVGAFSSGNVPLGAATAGNEPVLAASAMAAALSTARPAVSGVTVRPIGAGAPTAVGSAPVVGVRPRPAATPRGPRRARLNVKRIDPWSVMKFSFAVSLVLFVVVIVAASVLYLALDTMGVFTSINSTIAELVDAGGGETGNTFRITARGVIGTAAVLGALNVLLFTSLATLGGLDEGRSPGYRDHRLRVLRPDWTAILPQMKGGLRGRPRRGGDYSGRVDVVASMKGGLRGDRDPNGAGDHLEPPSLDEGRSPGRPRPLDEGGPVLEENLASMKGGLRGDRDLLCTDGVTRLVDRPR